MLVTGVNVIAIYVTDLKRAKTFYVDKLGFTDGGELPPGTLLKSGDATIYIEGGRSQTADGGLQSAAVSPCFATDGVKNTWQVLKSAGVSIETDYVEYGPEFALFRIHDPDGNLIEFAGTP